MSGYPPEDEDLLPSLNGITAELAEHSARLDHALDHTEDWVWFCATCQEVNAVWPAGRSPFFTHRRGCVLGFFHVGVCETASAEPVRVEGTES